MFSCEHKEETLATASSPVLSPTSSPAAVEAPVAVSKYWDDPKVYSPTVVVSRAGTNWGPSAIKTGVSGMTATYDADGDGAFDWTILFGIFAVLFMMGLIYECCCKKAVNA
jgi:hypothetical protein